MGALTGRLSPLAFHVKGKVENWDQVLDQLTRYRFQDLDPATGAHQAFGWVSLLDPFGTSFNKSSIFYGEHIVGLGMRVDAITIPASQVKLHLAHRAKLMAQEEGKERLSKAEFSALKEDIQAEFSRKVLPTIKVFDMIFHTETDRLWFFGKSKGVVETFLELFHETFGLVLVPDSPYTVAAQRLAEEETDRLLDLDQAVFVSDLD